MDREHRTAATSIGKVVSMGKKGRPFRKALDVQNFDLVVHIKIHQAEHWSSVLWMKLFFNKNNVIYKEEKSKDQIKTFLCKEKKKPKTHQT